MAGLHLLIHHGLACSDHHHHRGRPYKPRNLFLSMILIISRWQKEKNSRCLVRLLSIKILKTLPHPPLCPEMHFVHLIAALAFLCTVSAHFHLDYPYARGHNLVDSLSRLLHCIVLVTERHLQSSEATAPCGASFT